MSDLQCAATLVFARHGAYVDAPIWTSVPPGPRLSETGLEQARDLAAGLADRNVRHVYTSDLARAQETGQVVAEALGTGRTTLAGLRELSCGRFEGVTDRAVAAPIDEAFLAWLEGRLDARVEGGETGAEVLDRFRSAIEEIADQHRGETVVVVAHGGVLCLGLALLCADVTPAHVIAHPLDNCAQIEVVHDGDSWRALSWAGQPVGG